MRQETQENDENLMSACNGDDIDGGLQLLSLDNANSLDYFLQSGKITNHQKFTLALLINKLVELAYEAGKQSMV